MKGCLGHIFADGIKEYQSSPGLCPKEVDTWCEFNKAQFSSEPYVHREHLWASVLELVEQIHAQLTIPELIANRLDEKTQNCNESFNNVLGEHVPKNMFHT